MRFHNPEITTRIPTLQRGHNPMNQLQHGAQSHARMSQHYDARVSLRRKSKNIGEMKVAGYQTTAFADTYLADLLVETSAQDLIVNGNGIVPAFSEDLSSVDAEVFVELESWLRHLPPPTGMACSRARSAAYRKAARISSRRREG